MAMYDNEPTMMGQGRPSAALVIRQGPQAGMSFPLVGNQILIGREEGLDISLQDPEASRRHARVSWQAGQFVIEDLGSTNGTFVNGVQLTTPQILNAGDSVGIGQTALVFQVAGVQTATPQYQSPAPSAAPDAASESPEVQTTGFDSNKITQYVLYGCGCLLVLAICSLVLTAGIIILSPDILTQIGISP
jgi:pSer/pThr/pTyr-binding forkhead associated (FHA) protein